MGLVHQIGKAAVRVYANDHLPPHFHIISPDAEALVDLATLEVIAGTLPTGATGRKIVEWATDHRPEIVAEWNRINPRYPTT